MKRLAAALLLGAFAAPPALAATPFDGTWKADLSTLTMPKKADVFSLRRGRYSCDSCEPVISVWADGAPHRVAGHRYYDHIAVQAVNDRTLRITQLVGDRVTFSEEMTVAADGKTLAFTFRDMRGGAPVTGRGSERRIGAAPHPIAAHAVSGTWKLVSIEHASDAGLVFSLRSEGATMHMSTPTGQSYAAVVGGPPAPISGNLPGTMAALKRLSATTLQEIDTRGGRIVSVVTMTVAPGDRTMTVVTNETVHGAAQTYKAVKQ